MLTLSRKVDEEIMLGEDTIIVVSRLTNKRVILSIEAPKEVLILRAEVFDVMTVEERAEMLAKRLGEPSNKEISDG